jgi:hypothetical protein
MSQPHRKSYKNWVLKDGSNGNNIKNSLIELALFLLFILGADQILSYNTHNKILL